MLPNKMINVLRQILITALMMISTSAAEESDTAAIAAVNYEQHIRPLMIEKCSSCHGAIRQEAGLRLDAGSLILAGSEQGLVVEKGQPDQSLLIERVASADEALRMPPADSGSALTEVQLKHLAQWIAEGAVIPTDDPIPPRPDQHWAFQKPVRSEAIAEQQTSTNPVDQLLAVQWQSRGVVPLPAADKRTLLRRVYLDVIGLPPTPQQQRDFAADDSAEAWSRVVDALLADPAYGERWARHWMDVWRYSDWDGYKNELRGSQRHIWQWRDWIVESLNADTGYDQMVVAMLAGDETSPEDLNTLRATGFLARNFHVSNRDIWLDATVEHTARAFLSLTINCAKCHDHKFDPVSQHEYFAFRAIFEPHNVRTERLPGEPDLLKAGIPRVYDAKLDAPTWLYIAGDDKRPDKEHPITAAVPEILGGDFQPAMVTLPDVAVFPALREHIEREELETARIRLQVATDALKNFELQVASVQTQPDAATETSTTLIPESADPEAEPTERQILRQRVSAATANFDSVKARWCADKARFQSGSAEKKQDDQRNSLAQKAAALERQSLLQQAMLTELERRKALATASSATDGDEATRRKAVDKATTELQSAQKQLAEATQAMQRDDAGYSAVGTEYPATSTGRRTALARWMTSSENPLTARVAVNYIWLHHFGEPLVADVADFGMRSDRPEHLELLDSLAVELMDHGWRMKHIHRIILMSAAYRMLSSADSSLMANNEQKDPDNRLFWRMNSRRLEAEAIRDSVLSVSGSLDRQIGGPDIPHQQGELVARRSLYFQHAYEKQMTMLVTFDAAGPTECYRRSSSIVPQQALALSNSPLTIEQSRLLAGRITEQVGSDSDSELAFVEQAFEIILNRECTAAERDASVQFLDQQSLQLQTPAQLNQFVSSTKVRTAPAADPRQRARENLIHVLFNHNEFVSLR